MDSQAVNQRNHLRQELTSPKNNKSSRRRNKLLERAVIRWCTIVATGSG